MKLRITHLLFFCLFMSFSIINTTAVSQVTQTQQNQNSEGSRMNEEVERIRAEIRMKKNEYEEQRRMILELQNAISTIGGTQQKTPAATPAKTVSTADSRTSSYTANNTPRYVTSESTLSRLEALELLSKERGKHQMEMQIAQREIDLLKRQLNIANEQLNRNQSRVSTQEISERRTVDITPNKQNKTNKKKKDNKETDIQQQDVSPQFSETDSQILEEIDLMKNQIRERKARQEEQRKLIQDLLQAIEQK